MRAQIDRFVGWTGRDETCVSGIEVVPFISDEVAGYYRASTRHIELEEDFVDSTTVHELCHALDHEDSTGGQWASHAGADVLAPAPRSFPKTSTPRRWSREREAFARICAQGPSLVALLDALHDTCGLDGPDAAAEFVRGVAFPDASAGWAEMAAPVALDINVTDVVYAYAVLGSAGVFVHAEVVPSDGTDAIQPWILQLDPDTLAVVDTLALPPHGAVRLPDGPSVSAHSLLGSSTDPILYAYAGDDAGSAWRVRSAPLALDPIAWPAMDEGAVPRGFEADGVALVQTGYADPLLRVDLAEATVSDALGDDLPFDPGRPLAAQVDAIGAVGVYDSAEGAVVAATDADGGLTWSTHVPVPAGLVRSVVRLGDGSVVAAPSVADGTDSVGLIPVAVRYDPTTSTWALTEGCDALVGDGWFGTSLGAARVDAVEGTPGVWTLRFTERSTDTGG